MRTVVLPLVACATLSSSAACTRARGPETPPSVLLVTIDTLRADRVGAYGDAAARTPHLDALARQGVLFEAAVSPVPLTLPAHATMLTGLLPPAHGVRGNGSFALGTAAADARRGRCKRRGLAHRGLRRRLPGRAALRPRPRLRRLRRRLRARARPALRLRRAARRPRGRRGRWPGSRAPRAPRSSGSTSSTRTRPTTRREGFRGDDPYRGEIAFADAMLGRLLARLGRAAGAVGRRRDFRPRRGLRRARRGEPRPVRLRHHAARAAGAARRRACPRPGVSPRASRSRTCRRPWPSWRGPRRCRAAASRASTTPESERPAAALYAETLAPRLDFGWSELRAWRDGRYKYIRAPRPELYDLEADPGETRNLAGTSPRGRIAALGRRSTRSLCGWATRRAGAARIRRPPSGCARSDTCRARKAAARAPIPRTGSRWRVASRAPPGRSPTPQDAIAAYDEIARRDPENPLVNFRLADALLRAGRAARRRAATSARSSRRGRARADPFVGLATALRAARPARRGQARRSSRRSSRSRERPGALQPGRARAAARRRAARPAGSYEAARADPVTRERAEARLAGAGRDETP